MLTLGNLLMLIMTRVMLAWFMLFLGACGQRGPLYLPDATSTPPTHTP